MKVYRKKTMARMGAFLGAGDGAIYTGARRLPRDDLMDDVAEALSSSGTGLNVIRVKGPRPEGLGRFVSGLLSGNNAVLLYHVLDFPDWESELSGVLGAGTTLYYGQDLCHQVPVCVKRVF